MKRIKEVAIKNFKAFQDEEVFSLYGKNVLVYGNNGSGKSSLFWALYTFLQSSIKDDDEVKKYFKRYVVSNKDTHQTLKNIFVDSGEDSYVKITAIDEDTGLENIYTISHDTINTNNDDDTLIQELNIASDFINYKLLHNFFRASHRQEVNLWPVFEHDIFPFLTEDTNNWLEDIIKANSLDVPRISGGAVISGERKERYIEDEVDALNSRIQNLLTNIQNNANNFIKDHFYNGHDFIRIALNFNRKFKFDNIREKLWSEHKEGYRHEQLQIKLTVEVYDETAPGSWRKIERVQSFLNESQLTRIAIGVRIGALRTRPLAAARFKILVLDDMLISLDLSNRMDITRIILNKENKEDLNFFDGFQKIILTHDKGFFNLIRRNTDEEKWVYYNFNKDESKNTPPKIKEDLTPFQKASRYFEENEYENCGNELRKEAEAILTTFLDPEMKKLNGDFESLGKKLNKALNQVADTKFQKFKQVFLSDIELEKLKKIKEDYQADATLSEETKTALNNLKTRLFDFLIELNEQDNRKQLLIEQTQEILERVMNAASHHTDNPLYRNELKEAIEAIKNLKTYLTPSA
ncbi:AAA family ATPase [Draconibacterium sediminis]|uniref:AAA family ATPase n=1 Tax=Draconibacterium sediminis TaxID=1544798 RepID=UPI0026EA29BD|nr:AAA family ATPase [Draconibacterium sediminis]